MRHDFQFGDEEALFEAEELPGGVVNKAAVVGELIVAAQKRHAHVQIIGPHGVFVEHVHQSDAVERAVGKAILFIHDEIGDVIGDGAKAFDVGEFGDFQQHRSERAAVIETVDAGEEMMHVGGAAELGAVP